MYFFFLCLFAVPVGWSRRSTCFGFGSGPGREKGDGTVEGASPSLSWPVFVESGSLAFLFPFSVLWFVTFILALVVLRRFCILWVACIHRQRYPPSMASWLPSPRKHRVGGHANSAAVKKGRVNAGHDRGTASGSLFFKRLGSCLTGDGDGALEVVSLAMLPLVREGRLGKLWISLFYCKQIYKSTGAKLILRS